jgi:hypothetical protein
MSYGAFSSAISLGSDQKYTKRETFKYDEVGRVKEVTTEYSGHGSRSGQYREVRDSDLSWLSAPSGPTSESWQSDHAKKLGIPPAKVTVERPYECPHGYDYKRRPGCTIPQPISCRICYPAFRVEVGALYQNYVVPPNPFNPAISFGNVAIQYRYPL